jgi:predicted MFS family arabinose efflux permease
MEGGEVLSQSSQGAAVKGTAGQTSDGPVSFGEIVLVLAPFGFGYLMSYLFRAVNAVVAPDLVSEIGLNAAELGMLTAAYLCGFAIFQLPLGVLLDRYGPRRVQAALLIIAASGAALFAVGTNVWTLTAARTLIGLGFAGSLMSGFKAVVLWVPETRRALANACVMSLGAIGLIVSTAPMEWAVQRVGWRWVFLALALVTLLASGLIMVLVTERKPVQAGDTLRQQIAAVGVIYRDRAFWGLAPLLGISAGTHIAIQSLWAGPWLRDVAGLDRDGVAHQLLAMAVAFLVGILASGALTDWLVRRGVGKLTVMVGFLIVFMTSQAVIMTAWAPAQYIAWLAFGMSGQVAILAYPWLATHFGAALSGRANTAMNFLIFTSATAAQYVIGAIIDLFPKLPGGGYDLQAYRAGFGLFLAMELAALVWYFTNIQRYRAPPAATPKI